MRSRGVLNSAVLLIGLWPVFGSDPLEEIFPLEARGDIHFQADAARFLEDARPILEIALSVPEAGLSSPADSTRLEVTVELLDGDGDSKAQFQTRLTIPPGPGRVEGGFPVPQRWLRLNAPWVSGAVGARIRMEDAEGSKIGLWDRIRGNRPYGIAAARVIPEGESGEVYLMSDLSFVWGPTASVGVQDGDAGLRGVRSRLDPNPYRFYGLFQPVLTVYWERYPFPEETELAPVGLLARHRIIRLADTVEVHVTADTFPPPSKPAWSLRRFDLRDLPGGSYAYRLTLEDIDRPGSVLARREARFQVVWEKSNWLLEESDLLDLARVLLPADEFDHFASLDRGEQEAYLRALWNRHAPTEPGKRNPLEQRFLQRARYAATHFGGLRPGILSDRGRVYIRYGPPDETRFQLNPQDEELLWVVLPREIADTGVDDLDASARLSRHRTPLDNSAYEIWEYTMRGDPLIPSFVNPAQKVGLKFIFVDEMGTGDYTLVYSNVELQ